MFKSCQCTWTIFTGNTCIRLVHWLMWVQNKQIITLKTKRRNRYIKQIYWLNKQAHSWVPEEAESTWQWPSKTVWAIHSSRLVKPLFTVPLFEPLFSLVVWPLLQVPSCNDVISTPTPRAILWCDSPLYQEFYLLVLRHLLCSLESSSRSMLLWCDLYSMFYLVVMWSVLQVPSCCEVICAPSSILLWSDLCSKFDLVVMWSVLQVLSCDLCSKFRAMTGPA